MGQELYCRTGHRDRSFTVGQGMGTGALLWDRSFTVGQGMGTGALL